MLLVSNSDRISTIEKSTAERSRVVALRRAQARTAHDLLLSINSLARSRHIAHLFACRENACADNLLRARPCRGLLSCFPVSRVPVSKTAQNFSAEITCDLLQDCSLIAQKCAHRSEHLCGMKCRLEYGAGGEIERRF